MNRGGQAAPRKIMHRFSAKIQRVGVNPYVDVPARLTKHFGVRGYVPVTVRIGGGTVPSTLVPVGGGRHRLYINGIMRRLAAVDVGDRVAVGLVVDAASRMPRVPPMLATRWAENRLAQAAWARLRPSRRKEVLRYLNRLKSPAAQARMVAKILALLEPDP